MKDRLSKTPFAGALFIHDFTVCRSKPLQPLQGHAPFLKVQRAAFLLCLPISVHLAKQQLSLLKTNVG
jgi:hypothetical protein